MEVDNKDLNLWLVASNYFYDYHQGNGSHTASLLFRDIVSLQNFMGGHDFLDLNTRQERRATNVHESSYFTKIRLIF